MKCTLIRCPETLGKYVSAGYAVPPIGPAYIAASLVEAGHEVEVIDPTGEALDQFTEIDGETLRRGLTDEEIISRVKPSDVIGFSLLSSLDWLSARRLIAEVHARFPDSVLVAGGEHFTADPEGALEQAPGLDVIVLGEGDRVICDLLRHLEERKPLGEVAGIYYRLDGRIRKSEAAARIRDIDKLPWPAWDLIPLENYLRGGHGWGVDRGRNMPLIASRGCPYRCTFCSNPTMWTSHWIARSPKDVIEEIKHYVEHYQVSNFDFHDLTAIIRKDWAVEFCRLLIAEELNITWQLPTGTRSEALDAEVLPLLYASGCRNITYSPESGSEEILRRVKKKVKLDRMLKSMRACVRSGCNVKANFVFGFPGDAYRSYLQTFGFLARMAIAGVHDISIAPFRPYPGSELFRELQARGVLPMKLDDAYYRDIASAAENLPFSKARPRSYTDHMTDTGLHRLCLTAQAWFFLLSWMLRPHRIAKMIRAFVTGRQESRLDKSLAEMKRRVINSRKGKAGNAIRP